MLHEAQVHGEAEPHLATLELAAHIEPFNFFSEAPEDIESGYARFHEFYRRNISGQYIRLDRQSRILVISCGAGYFVKLLNEQGYPNVLGIDSFESKVAHARGHGLECRVERAFPSSRPESRHLT